MLLRSGLSPEEELSLFIKNREIHIRDVIRPALERGAHVLCDRFSDSSLLFVGFSQISLRKSYKELPPSVAFLFDSIFGLLIWVPLAFFMGISGTVSWGQAIFFAVVSAILSEAIVFYALSHGELAVTATVLATYPVYTVIFSRLFNGEILSP